VSADTFLVLAGDFRVEFIFALALRQTTAAQAKVNPVWCIAAGRQPKTLYFTLHLMELDGGLTTSAVGTSDKATYISLFQERVHRLHSKPFRLRFFHQADHTR
jgi:hypothetical protein